MNEFLKKPIRTYVYLGIWPLVGSSKFFNEFRYVFGLLFVIGIVVLDTFAYIGISTQWGDWGTVFEAASFSFMFTIVLVKIYVVHSQRDKMILLSKNIDSYVNEIFLDNYDNKIAILLDYQQRVNNINNFIWISSSLTFVFICLWPISFILLTQDYSLRLLMIQAYFPFSLNTIGNYVATYLMEIVLGFITLMHSVTFEIFFIACILFAIARIKILQHSIERVDIVARQKCNTICKNESIYSRNWNEKFQIYFGIELKKCIEEHQRIEAFCKTINSLISPVLFILWFSYSIIMCVIGMYAMFVEPSLNVWKLGQYLAVLFSQIFIYFWYGDELLTESIKVADSAWESNWYDFGKRNIKMIIFMISRSQNGISMSVGKFREVDLPTFLSLMGTSYSYFALLKTILRVNE